MHDEKRIVRNLLPYTLPYAYDMNDSVEKDYISEYTPDNDEQDRIDHPFSFTFYLVEATDSFRSEIPYESKENEKHSENAKVPFIFSIECIWERCRERYTPESECYDNDRRETAERRKNDTSCDNREEFFHGWSVNVILISLSP